MLRNFVYFDQSNENIEDVGIFGSTHLYIAYADDSTFSLKNLNSVKKLRSTIEIFSSFLGLKPNLSKFEISAIGALKGVTVAVCGINCFDLIKECFEIPGIYYSYNKNLQTEENFLKTITKWRRY